MLWQRLPDAYRVSDFPGGRIHRRDIFRRSIFADFVFLDCAGAITGFDCDRRRAADGASELVRF
jgi:hypothetical protein